MIIASLFASAATFLIELFTRGKGIVLVSYGFIVLLLIFLPRFFLLF